VLRHDIRRPLGISTLLLERETMHTLTAPQRRDRPDHPSSAQTFLDRASDDAAHLTVNPSAFRLAPERSTVLDRLALRIALALVLWSTRPRRPALSPTQLRAARDRDLREQSWQQRHLRLPAI
jgi:hypothetical protein